MLSQPPCPQQQRRFRPCESLQVFNIGSPTTNMPLVSRESIPAHSRVSSYAGGESGVIGTINFKAVRTQIQRPTYRAAPEIYNQRQISAGGSGSVTTSARKYINPMVHSGAISPPAIGTTVWKSADFQPPARGPPRAAYFAGPNTGAFTSGYSTAGSTSPYSTTDRVTTINLDSPLVFQPVPNTPQTTSIGSRVQNSRTPLSRQITQVICDNIVAQQRLRSAIDAPCKRKESSVPETQHQYQPKPSARSCVARPAVPASTAPQSTSSVTPRPQRTTMFETPKSTLPTDNHSTTKSASMTLSDSNTNARRLQTDSNTSTRASPRISCQRSRIGFPNKGNTCYYNAVLQGLLGFNDFVSHFLMNKNEIQTNLRSTAATSRYEGKLMVAWLQLLRCVFSESGGGGDFDVHYVEVLDLIIRNSPQISRGQQNDAHELFHALIYSLGEEFLGSRRSLLMSKAAGTGVGAFDDVWESYLSQFQTEKKKTLTPPALFFNTLLTTRMKCKACSRIKYKSEVQLDWQLEMPKGSSEAGDMMTLQDLLDYTFEMKDTLYVECERCESKQKPTEIQRYPTRLSGMFLCIQLKRFGWDAEAGKSYRVNTPINLELPCTINLAKYDDGQQQPHSAIFDVMGVTLQTGNSLEMGHYTSIQFIYDQFYVISDQKYEPFNTSERIDPKALYIIWLRRRTPIYY